MINKRKHRPVGNERRFYDQKDYTFYGRTNEEKCITLLLKVNERFAYERASGKKLRDSHHTERVTVIKSMYAYISKIKYLLSYMKSKCELEYIKNMKFETTDDKTYLVFHLDLNFYSDTMKFIDPVKGYAYAMLKKYDDINLNFLEKEYEGTFTRNYQ